MNSSPKLLIVGRVPPPYGGVSVHLYRLTEYLKMAGFPFQFCDLSGSSNSNFINCNNLFRLTWALIARRYSVVHCHASNPLLVILIGLVSALLNRKAIYTLHGEGNLLTCENGSFPLKTVLRFVLRRATRIITINSNCYTRACQLVSSSDKILQMPAYLPPTPSEFISQPISDRIEEFLLEHSVCFASQGTFGNKYQGLDLYRFDLMAEALLKLRETVSTAGLISFISQTLDPAARDEVFGLRQKMGLDHHWLILENFGSALPIYLRCKAFIRPTMSDGDSLSIRECLDLGIPVIASDAVPRPDGCIIFKTGDVHSLHTSILSLLTDYKYFNAQVKKTKTDNCYQPLLKCYIDCLAI
ncbi:glycosyltransferase family protein [Geomonas ferrireducens]|uniref:glycosyltransferase n=1 Tax=Geomonas ferrireducens TaxID=2570227 RepID=UPI0010A8923D|nr:glycosyltransferase [Geomonas ferrireducens]